MRQWREFKAQSPPANEFSKRFSFALTSPRHQIMAGLRCRAAQTSGRRGSDRPTNTSARAGSRCAALDRLNNDIKMSL
jgi:hypothetical protein